MKSKLAAIAHKAEEGIMMNGLSGDRFNEILEICGIDTGYNPDVKLATQYAFSYIGTWYSWGGDDPSGFDCSRFTGEIQKAMGLLPRKSVAPTAAGQWDMNVKKRVAIPYEGCMVCYWNPAKTKISHIEYCINDKFSIGASGGGSKTKTREDAIRDNAWIKMRRIDSRKLIAGYFDPFMKEPT